MNNKSIIILVEGETEKIFINKILAPYLSKKNIFLETTLFSKKGQKGGDIKFSRAVNDIITFFKAQKRTFYLTTFFDYYGVKEWPGIDKVPCGSSPQQIADIINRATKDELIARLPNYQIEKYFIPFIAVHEFEALLFSDSLILAKSLNISENKILKILKECKEPEAINTSPDTAPSKRLNKLISPHAFKKTTTGIAILEKIGIDKIRKQCPLFHAWVSALEEN